MELGISVLVDIVFKKVFGSRDHPEVTLSFVNALLVQLGLPRVRSVKVENPFVLRDFTQDKDIVVDIMARDEDDQVYQIELQAEYHAALPERMLYGLCRLVSGQLKTGRYYTQLRRALSVWIVDSPFLTDGKWLETYTLQGDASRQTLSRMGMVVVIDLPAWHRSRGSLDLRKAENWDRLETELDVWLAMILASDSLEPEHLPSRLHSGAFHEAIEVMEMFFIKTPHARHLARAREEAKRLRGTEEHWYAMRLAEGLAKAKVEGEAIGRQEGMTAGMTAGMEAGMAAGMATGKIEGKIETARAMLAKGISVDMVLEITGLTRDQIEDTTASDAEP